MVLALFRGRISLLISTNEPSSNPPNPLCCLSVGHDGWFGTSSRALLIKPRPSPPKKNPIDPNPYVGPPLT